MKTNYPWHLHEGRGILIRNKDGFPVAQLEMVKHIADAKLMAAAPEMYVALLNCEASIIHDGPGGMPRTKTERQILDMIKRIKEKVGKGSTE